MIRLLFSVVLLSFIPVICLGQAPKRIKKPETRDEFFAKSKNQRTAAWLLFGAGVISIAAVSSGNSGFGTTGAVAVLGGAAILTSIPLFIAARKNKRRGRSMPISLELRNIPNIPAYIKQPPSSLAMSIKVSL